MKVGIDISAFKDLSQNRGEHINALKGNNIKTLYLVGEKKILDLLNR